ncbi:MAG TPA: fluoride efflux transporter CrcB [Sphingomonadaceae bacterium]
MAVPSQLAASVYVALGGGTGAVLRYQAGRLMTTWLGPERITAFPWGTMSINVTGSVLMGVVAGILARHGEGGEFWRLLVGIGVLGGFTTFSSFSLELVLLIERQAYAPAVAYALGSVLAGAIGLWLGLAATRAIG